MRKTACNVTRMSYYTFTPQQANQIKGPELCVTVLKGHFVLTSELNVNFSNRPDKNYKFPVPKFLRTLFQCEYHLRVWPPFFVPVIPNFKLHKIIYNHDRDPAITEAH